MRRLIWTGLAVPICAALWAPVGGAQTPAPPVSTPPPPAVAPPTGGPNSPPLNEPANAIAKGIVTPGANAFSEADVRGRLEKAGYARVSGLHKGDDGIWHGQAMKNGASVRVSLDSKGNIASN